MLMEALALMIIMLMFLRLWALTICCGGRARVLIYCKLQSEASTQSSLAYYCIKIAILHYDGHMLIYCKLQRKLFKQSAQVLVVGTKICKVINCNNAHFLEEGPFETDPKCTAQYWPEMLYTSKPQFTVLFTGYYLLCYFTLYLILHWAGKRPRTERIWGLLQVILHKLWKNFHFVKTHIFCYADYLNDILDTWNT